MTRPTDLYLADLLNEAANDLAMYATASDINCKFPGLLINRLQAASKAMRENPDIEDYVRKARGLVRMRELMNPEQRFREADGQGSFHDEKPR